jgi:hypothetical protein
VMMAWELWKAPGFTSIADTLIVAARKHYQRIADHKQRDILLPELLALVVSHELSEGVTGKIWQEALEDNYMDILSDGTVRFHYKPYAEELARLVKGGTVKQYARILHDLLSSPDIVRHISRSALGVHVEDALDLAWKEHACIGWSQSFRFPEGIKGGKRSSDKVEFKDFLVVNFDGDFPKPEQLEAWTNHKFKMMYLKPNKPNYWGFDMFVVVWAKTGSTKVVIHPIQVTVSASKEHEVGAFFKPEKKFMETWAGLVRTPSCNTVAWFFHMLTPETDTPKAPPGAKEGETFDQISFADLQDTCTQDCLINVVKNLPSFLTPK